VRHSLWWCVVRRCASFVVVVRHPSLCIRSWVVVVRRSGCVAGGFGCRSLFVASMVFRCRLAP
jgi:hypothetical protein